MAVALLVAAGRGERLGAEGPKAFVVLAGRPMLDWSLDALRARARRSRASSSRCRRAWTRRPARSASAGGAERSHSVRAALAAAGELPDDEPVIVHDAARPLATPELFERALAALAAHGCDAVVAAARVTDTVKRARRRRPARRRDARPQRAVGGADAAGLPPRRARARARAARRRARGRDRRRRARRAGGRSGPRRRVPGREPEGDDPHGPAARRAAAVANAPDAHRLPRPPAPRRRRHARRRLLHARRTSSATAQPPTSAASPSWAAPSTSTASARRSTCGSTRSGARTPSTTSTTYCEFAREQGLKVGVEADFVRGPRGPHGERCSTAARGTT